MEEQELIAGLKAGRPEAQDEAYRRYSPRLKATAVHFLGWQDPEVEDAVQETFLAAYQSAPRFEGRSSLATWLTAICVNQCWNRLRKRGRLIMAQDQDLELLGTDLARRRHEAGQLRAEQAARARLLMGLLKKLGQPCRQLLELRWVEGLNTYAIKQRLGLPLGTVTSRMARCQEQWRTAARRHEKKGGRRG